MTQIDSNIMHTLSNSKAIMKICSIIDKRLGSMSKNELVTLALISATEIGLHLNNLKDFSSEEESFIFMERGLEAAFKAYDNAVEKRKVLLSSKQHLSHFIDAQDSITNVQ